MEKAPGNGGLFFIVWTLVANSAWLYEQGLLIVRAFMPKHARLLEDCALIIRTLMANDARSDQSGLIVRALMSRN